MTINYSQLRDEIAALVDHTTEQASAEEEAGWDAYEKWLETRQDALHDEQPYDMGMCTFCHQRRTIDERGACQGCRIEIDTWEGKISAPPPYRQRYAENMVWEPVF